VDPRIEKLRAAGYSDSDIEGYMKSFPEPVQEKPTELPVVGDKFEMIPPRESSYLSDAGDLAMTLIPKAAEAVGNNLGTIAGVGAGLYGGSQLGKIVGVGREYIGAKNAATAAQQAETARLASRFNTPTAGAAPAPATSPILNSAGQPMSAASQQAAQATARQAATQAVAQQAAATGGAPAAQGATFLQRMATQFAQYAPAARALTGIGAALYSPSVNTGEQEALNRIDPSRIAERQANINRLTPEERRRRGL
jgi:hypothetical protein